jgi:hypothetical protein
MQGCPVLSAILRAIKHLAEAGKDNVVAGEIRREDKERGPSTWKVHRFPGSAAVCGAVDTPVSRGENQAIGRVTRREGNSPDPLARKLLPYGQPALAAIGGAIEMIPLLLIFPADKENAVGGKTRREGQINHP